MEASNLISIPIGKFHFVFSYDIITQWVIMAILIVLMVWATRDLKRVPGKKQTVAELLYNTMKNVVDSNMGEEYESYIPILGTMAVFLLLMNYTGFIGVRPPTQNYNIALGLALCSFVLIHVNGVKKMGMKAYISSYGKPFVLMAPINIMEKIVFPVSLSLRLFGNMAAATMITDLVYETCGNFAIGLPIPVHLYFDLFDGALQVIVFVLLTMIQIKILAEE